MTMLFKPLSTKDYMDDLFKQKKDLARKEKYSLDRHNNEIKKNNVLKEAFYSRNDNRKIAERKRNSLATSINSVLCKHSLYTMLESVTKEIKSYVNKFEPDLEFMHRTVDDFIDECGGADSLISSMGRYRNSMFLTELHSIINNGERYILEEVGDESDPDNVDSDPEKTNFVKNKIDDHLKSSNLEIDIADRVAKEIEDYMCSKAADKETIINALEKTKEKVESIDPESSYEDDSEPNLEYGSIYSISKEKISKIRNKDHKLFGTIIESMTRNLVKNENLRKSYITENSNLDIGKIMDRGIVLYSFMETVNSIGLVKIDSNYIKNVLNELS